MPISEKPRFNTLAWVAQWINQPKISASVDNVKLIQHQVFEVADPSDLPGRAGVDGVAKPDESKTDKQPALPSKGLWLIGNDIYGILFNHQSDIGWTPPAHEGAPVVELNDTHGRKVADFIEMAGYIGTEFIGEGKLRDIGAITTGTHISTFEQGIVQRLKQRFAEAGRTLYYKTTYGGFHTFWHTVKPGFRKPDGVHTQPNDPYWKAALQSRAVARSRCSFFALGYDEMGMVHDVKFYAEDFMSRKHFWNVLYAVRVCVFGTTNDNGTYKNRVCLHFWSKVEQLPTEGVTWSIHNGFRYRRDVPALNGYVISTEHPQVDHELLVAMCVATYTEGVNVDGREGIADVWNWENSEIFGTNPLKMTRPNPNPNQDRANFVSWFNASTNLPDNDNAPFTDGVKGYPESPMGYMDIGPKAKMIYNTTSKTAGKQWQDCKYKCIERNGERVTEDWVTPANYGTQQNDGTQLLEWASMYDGYNTTGPGKVHGGLYARVREKSSGGQTHVSLFWYHPGRNPNVIERYDFQTPSGKVIRLRVQGAVCDMFNESY